MAGGGLEGAGGAQAGLLLLDLLTPTLGDQHVPGFLVKLQDGGSLVQLLFWNQRLFYHLLSRILPRPQTEP